jgi:hypothetical protein
VATHDYKITVAASDRQPVSGPVNFIRLHASTGNLKIDIEGKVTELAVGQAIVLDELIDVFHVVNETVSDVDATFKLGAGAQVTDNNLSGTVALDKSTTGDDTADQVIAPGGTLVIAADGARRNVKLCADPNNGDAGRVSYTGGERGDFLQPGLSVVVDCTDAVSVHNPSASAGDINVGVLYEKD